jgi:hypothetical protein
MTADQRDEGCRVPTSADASRILAEITPVTRRARQLARDVTFARPLLAWGLAWVAGALMYEFVRGVPGIALGLAACAGAAAVSWLVRPREVRLHSEQRFAQLWIALFATSPLLVIVVAPANGHILVAFLGCLWAVALLLYGVGVKDIPLATVGLTTVAAAAVARLAAPGVIMLAVGLAGGLGMAALGGWRMRWKR